MSTSRSTERFGELARRSLDILAREHPQAHAALARRLAGLAAALRIDGERVILQVEAGVPVISTGAAEVEVELRATRRALLRLLDGEASLLDAVRDGSVALSGGIGALARFHDALLDYLRGAVRCPSFPPLLDDLRAQAQFAEPAGAAPCENARR